MKDPKRPGNIANYVWHEWLRPLLAALAIVAPIKSAIADWNWVPSGSMKPTILEGDLVAINKLAYDFKVPFTLMRLAEWRQPANGEIVIFFSPKDGTRLVKRVVGSPGDTLEMRGNVLFRNGKKLSYSLAGTQSFDAELYEDPHPVVALENDGEKKHWVMALPARGAHRDFLPVTVPPGKYFMMGDSRDNSFDSRFFGFVDREQIVGRAGEIILSFDKNHFYRPRFDRFFSPFDEM